MLRILIYVFESVRSVDCIVVGVIVCDFAVHPPTPYPLWLVGGFIGFRSIREKYMFICNISSLFRESQSVDLAMFTAFLNFTFFIEAIENDV